MPCMCGGCSDCLLDQGYSWEEVLGPDLDQDRELTTEEQLESLCRRAYELLDLTDDYWAQPKGKLPF